MHALQEAANKQRALLLMSRWEVAQQYHGQQAGLPCVDWN